MWANIDVSMVLFGGGNVISIVLLREKKCAEGAFFPSFRLWVCFVFYCYFVLFFTLDFFTSSSERGVFRKQKTDFSINKLDQCHRSQGLFVEALKLPIWKLKKRQKCNSDTVYHFFFFEKKRFSVCWKQQHCDNLKKKTSCAFILSDCVSVLIHNKSLISL